MRVPTWQRKWGVLVREGGAWHFEMITGSMTAALATRDALRTNPGDPNVLLVEISPEHPL